MTAKVIHQPRIAWDFAQVVLAAAEADDDLYLWFGTRVSDLLGPSYRGDLDATRVRLARGGARPVEAGVWRVRLEDLLRTRADLAQYLRILRDEVGSRLAQRG